MSKKIAGSLIVALMIVACDNREPGRDSGVEVDAGSDVDAGSSDDAGSIADAGSDAGMSGPCNMTPVLTCTDAEYCDEVYSEESATELEAVCMGEGVMMTTMPCMFMQCCYFPT